MAGLAFLAAGLVAAAAVVAPATAAVPARTSVHVDNPYLGAAGYVNPQWSALASTEPGGAQVSGTPTAVWLDSIDSIDGAAGNLGLRAHLDEALAQGAGYIQFVINNLPGRDCNRLIAEGELGPAELTRYRAEYIDPIAAVMADPRYQRLRIITIIEVRALPNLVFNTTPRPTATPACDTMR